MAKKFLTSITISASSGGEYTFPIADGTANQAIITDGDGNLSFGSAVASSAEDAQRLVCEMINASGSTIGAFLPVCCVGMHSDGTPEIAPARADNALYMPAIGVTQASVGNNNRTDVLLYGKIENVNTTAYQTGDTLYVAPTGGWTTTRPTGTNYIQAVLKVGRVHANNGSGGAFGAGKYEDLPNLGTGKIWVGDSSSYPVATSISAAVTAAYGYTPANAATYVPYTGATSVLNLGVYSMFNSGTYITKTGTSSNALYIQHGSGGSLASSGYSAIGVSGTDGITFSYNGSTNTITFKNNLLTGARNYSLPDASGTIALTSDLNSYVPASRTLTINGTAYDLSADRSWTIAPSASARTEQIFTATSGQTTFTVTGGYVVGLVDVYVNGVKLLPSDFTATNGSTVVLATGAVLNDSVTIINYTATIAALPTSRDTIDYTATSAQTTFTVSGGYAVGLLDVYVNGVKLTSSEYTATNGTTFVLAVASVTGDQVQAIRYNASITGVSGSGTSNYVPKFTASGTLGNSLIQDDGTTVSINAASSNLLITRGATSNSAFVSFGTAGTTRWQIGLRGTYSTEDLYIWNPVLGIPYITFSSTNSLANFGVDIRALSYNSYTASGICFQNSSAGTNSVHMRLNNTGGDLRMGIDSSAGGGFQTGTSAYAAVFGNQANYATQFTTNGTVRMTITAGGNVGVNTNSPNDYIDGESGMTILQSTNGRAVLSLAGTRVDAGETLGRISFTNTNSTNAGSKRLAYINGARGTTNNSAYLEFAVANNALGSVAMTLSQAGNLGIGATSPSSRLMIDGDYADMTGSITYSTNTKGIIINQDAGGGYGTGLWFRQAGLTAGIASTRVSSGDWATDLRFYNHPASTSNQNILYERMRINSEGDVYIGTTARVNAGGYSNAVSIKANTTNTWGLVEVRGAGTTNGGELHLGGDTAIYAALVGEYTSTNNGNLYIRTLRSGTLTPAMMVTSGGQVVCGSTSNDGYGFQVYGASSFNGQIKLTQVAASSGYVNETKAVDSSSSTYFLNKDTGTANGSSYTYFNIGGVSNAPGTIVHITLRVSKGATGSAINTQAYVQINGQDMIGVTTANGTGALTIIKTFTAVYNSTNGWQIIGSVGTY